jgi:hypothetical protein
LGAGCWAFLICQAPDGDVVVVGGKRKKYNKKKNKKKKKKKKKIVFKKKKKKKKMSLWGGGGGGGGTDPRLRTLPKEMAKGMAASPEWSTAMTPPPRPPGSEERSARYGSPAMAREQPLAPPSSRARRPPKKVGERRRRVAMSQRDERERWAEALTERGKGNGGQALSARGLMEEDSVARGAPAGRAFS